MNVNGCQCYHASMYQIECSQIFTFLDVTVLDETSLPNVNQVQQWRCNLKFG
jgi:hypothetical protein